MVLPQRNRTHRKRAPISFFQVKFLNILLDRACLALLIVSTDKQEVVQSSLMKNYETVKISVMD